MATDPGFSRRERQVMDIVHELGSATAAAIREHMPDPPTDAAVRSVLRILVEKGHLSYSQDGPRYVYSATLSGERARRKAMSRVLRTFFGGSVEGAVAALMEIDGARLSAEDRDRLKKLIDEAAEEGR
ncbi:MAG: BlaI/MecI/CopY family transcriptional regulator [Gemmatimonadota bacterium]|nr:BlaI/MecI/CopY family transcriptional regulator [Gemmatimonadota bacterium]